MKFFIGICGGPWRAIFECVGPMDVDDEDPVNPPGTGYKWLNLDRTRRLIDEGTLKLASNEDRVGFYTRSE